MKKVEMDKFIHSTCEPMNPQYIDKSLYYHSRKACLFLNNSKHKVVKFLKLYYHCSEIQDLLIYNCKPYYLTLHIFIDFINFHLHPSLD